VGKERGWIIMKKQTPQDAIQSTYVVGIGRKIIKWWGGDYSKEGAHYV
jgi:hypothetical protein